MDQELPEEPMGKPGVTATPPVPPQTQFVWDAESKRRIEREEFARMFERATRAYGGMDAFRAGAGLAESYLGKLYEMAKGTRSVPGHLLNELMNTPASAAVLAEWFQQRAGAPKREITEDEYNRAAAIALRWVCEQMPLARQQIRERMAMLLAVRPEDVKL